MTKRRYISQLPAINQTETLTKFFGSTVDQVFQPGTPEKLAGYIGLKPSYYDSKKDFYISEPSTGRETYQLVPIMTSGQPGSQNTDHELFYDDYINYLKSNSAITSDHNRMFSDTLYSWAPPIDLDKLDNFQYYYWFGDDIDVLPAVILTSQTLIFTGDGTNTTFGLPIKVAGIDTTREFPMVFVNGFRVPFVRIGDDEVRIGSAPGAGSTITTFRYGDLRKAIEGQTHFDPSPFTTQPVKSLTSSMKLILNDGYYQFAGWDTMPWDSVFINNTPGFFEYPSWETFRWDLGFLDVSWDGGTSDLARAHWCEGVGVSIELIPVTNPVDIGLPNYVVMDRRCKDGNPWARANFWVHEEAFSWSGEKFITRKASRPIIEFIPNIELFDYGTNRLPNITGTLTGEPYTYPKPYTRKYNEDTVGLVQIPVASVSGMSLGSILVDRQRTLLFGDRILVTNNTNPSLNNRIITVISALGKLAFSVSAPPKKGDVTRIDPLGFEPWDTKAWDTGAWDGSDSAVDFYFDGTKWIESNVGLANTDPLFALYTDSAVKLETISNFKGNRLFGYANGTGAIDKVLNRSLKFSNSGEIVFENDIATRHPRRVDGSFVTGFQYYNVYTEETYHNGWFPRLNKTSQTIDANGLWSLPLNLTANANNDEVTFISKGQWFDHITSNIAAQRGLTGSLYGNNNWRDTPRTLGLGKDILQHRSPMLKAMLLASDKRFDLFDAIRYAEREYTKFKNKVLQQIARMLNDGTHMETDSPELWVSSILEVLKIGKTTKSPFALSAAGGAGNFIPPTPQWLGIFSPVNPRFELDTTYTPAIKIIIGHDGSRTPSFGDFKDDILLSLENRIFTSINPKYKDGTLSPFNFNSYKEGRYRQAKDVSTVYSRDELVSIYESLFIRWARQNKLDYFKNNGFQQTDCFSWNIRGMPDRDGRPAPGNWRALYRYYYDTDRPHLAPWEMLGFSTKPVWFDSQYGPAPYTSDNLPLWRDLRDGYIRGGARTGFDQRFSRSDLFAIIPVDSSGNLRNTMDIGLITQPPTFDQAIRPWIIGDQGPVENLWMMSSSYAFSAAQMAAVMRPAQFVESGWDLGNLDYINDQWINDETHNRPHSSSLVVHGERLTDGTRAIHIGIQQWIVDLMASITLSPSILGNAVRGLQANLGHRMSGFTSGKNLSLFTDNSGLIPTENVKVVYYSPPAFRELFYSAIIIEWTGNGFKVVGYDNKNPYFKVLPGDQFGPKTPISLGNNPTIYDWHPNASYRVGILVEYNLTIYSCATQHTSGPKFEKTFWTVVPGVLAKNISVNVCDTGLPESKVEYGTIFTSIQDTASFLRDYYRWMEKEGFSFDEPDHNGVISDWFTVITEFLRWSQLNWSAGNFIAMSPGAANLNFTANFGQLNQIDQDSNGFYGLLNRNAAPLPKSEVFISRVDEKSNFITSRSNLYGARLSLSAVEHVIVLSNTTIFGDLIYSPLLNLWQPRIRLNGFRTSDWLGRRDAPGFVIENNDIAANFDRAAEDIRYMYDIDDATVNPVLLDHARSLSGYQNKTYFSSLLISQTEQFEFYQGMIQAKGTPNVFGNLIRSKFIDKDSDLRFLEEWAFRVGRYGDLNSTAHYSFKLVSSDVTTERQLVMLDNFVTSKSVISLPFADSRWIEKPIAPGIFPEVLSFDRMLPNGGYVKLNEISLTVARPIFLTTLFNKVQYTTTAFQQGTRVWIYDRGDGDFEVLEAFGVGVGNAMTKIQTTSEDPTLANGTMRIVFRANHGMATIDIGLHCVIPEQTGTDPSATGIWDILNVESATTIIIDTNQTFNATGIDYTVAGSGSPSPLYVLRPLHFKNRTDAQTFWKRYQPVVNQRMWVDDAGSGTWAVYSWDGTQWTIAREQPLRTDPSIISRAMIYDNRPSIDGIGMTITDKKILNEGLEIYHPLIGYFSGAAKKELSFITENDPASYYDTGSMWGKEQVGKLWWDLSSIFFIDAETDRLDSLDANRTLAELNYRYANWGRVAPGTAINIYEWTRSVVSPYDYTGGLIRPITGFSGSNSYDYATRQEWDDTSLSFVTAYYFWILNPNIIPNAPDRTMTAQDVVNLIANQPSLGTATITPIAQNAFILGNVASQVNNYYSVFELQLKDINNQAVSHTEWQLVRPNDDRLNAADPIWNWIKFGLIGLDRFGANVPSPSLNQQFISGNLSGQSIFGTSIIGARKSFVKNVNRILSETSITTDNPMALSKLTRKTPTFETLLWSQTYAEEPIALLPAKSYDFYVTGMTERDLFLHTADFTEFDSKSLHRKPRIAVFNPNSHKSNWSIWEIDRDKISQGPTACLTIAKNFTATVPTYADLVNNKTSFAIGQRVLVSNDETINNFWSVWSYEPGNFVSNSDGFIFENRQTYDTKDFISTIDWYEKGYSISNPPTASYATTHDRNIKDGLIAGTYALVKNDGTGKWIWTAYDGNSWSVVARQNGAIVLSTQFYNPSRLPPASLTNSNIVARDGTFELRELFEIIKNELLAPLQLSDLFFSMVHFANVSQSTVDWAFKTSFLSIFGYREKLDQTPVIYADNVKNILDYVDDVKPYRVKMREYEETYAVGPDLLNLHAMDFDKPPYVDNGVTRILDINSDVDFQILNTEPWADWFNIYTISENHDDPASPDYNPVRSFNLNIKFDRIDPFGTAALLRDYGWDIGPFESYGFDDEIAQINGMGSALDRLLNDYVPELGMRAKDAALIFDLDYRGDLRLHGGSFLTNKYDIVYTGGDGGVTIQGSSFCEPMYAPNRPQELIYSHIDDVVSIIVDTEWSPGAPLETVSNINVSTGYPKVATVAIGQLVDQKDSVLLFADGLKILNAGATVDIFEQTVTLPVNTYSAVSARSFGSSGLTQIIERRLFDGDGVRTVFTMSKAAPWADVIVDGSIVSSTISGASVTLSVAPATDAEVMIITRLTNDGTYVHQDSFYFTTNSVFALTNASSLASGSDVDESGATMVYINGKRLLPAFTRHIGGTARYPLEYKMTSSSSTAVIYLDGIPYDGKVGIVDFNNNKPLYTYFDLLNQSDFAANQTPDFVMIGDMFYINRPTNAVDIAIVDPTTGDYTLSGTTLTVTAPMVPGDRIDVVSFTNPDLLFGKIDVFVGSPIGAYNVAFAPRAKFNKENYVYVSVDGTVLTPDVDFTVYVKRSSYDVDLYDHTSYDDDDYRMTVFLNGPQTTSQTVVIQVFCGVPVLDENKWISESISPDSGREHSMFGIYETSILDDVGSGTLTVDLKQHDAQIVVALTQVENSVKAAAGSAFRVPSDGVPGVLWIDGERIEYFDLQVANNIATFGSLRRGTHITSVGLEQRVVAKSFANGSTTTFALEGASLAYPVEVIVGEAGQTSVMKQNVHYHLQDISGIVYVVFTIAPPVGPVVIAQTIGRCHEVGSTVYNISGIVNKDCPFRDVIV
jgi:hypothetical protein